MLDCWEIPPWCCILATPIAAPSKAQPLVKQKNSTHPSRLHLHVPNVKKLCTQNEMLALKGAHVFYLGHGKIESPYVLKVMICCFVIENH